MNAAKGLAAAICVLLCAGCAGLPPKQARANLANVAPLDDLPASGGGIWPARDWWKRYQDPALDQLIDLAVASSPTLETAHARFDLATQAVRLAGAVSGAHIDARAQFERQRLSDNGLFPTRLFGFNWYNQADLGLQASYSFDWWGKQRSQVAAAMDQAHAAQADRSAAALMLEGAVADGYFGWQADQARLKLMRERESALQAERAIAIARINAQLDSPDTGSRAELALADAREVIATLEGSAELRIIALASLVGRPASQLPVLRANELPIVLGMLPDNVTIDLIARRADITASRWRVLAAEANRQAARAEFFPDLTLNILAGLSSIDAGKLLEYGSRVPQAGVAVHLPIFDAGRLKARYGVSQAEVASAVSNYQETLVSAARDVAQQVASRAQLAAQRMQRAIEVAAAQSLQSAAAARVRQGIVDSRSELSATESLLQQRDALLQLDAAALTADIALQRALGGGYENPTTKQSP